MTNDATDQQDNDATVKINLPEQIKYAFDGCRVEAFGPGEDIEVPREVAQWCADNIEKADGDKPAAKRKTRAKAAT